MTRLKCPICHRFLLAYALLDEVELEVPCRTSGCRTLVRVHGEVVTATEGRNPALDIPVRMGDVA